MRYQRFLDLLIIHCAMKILTFIIQNHTLQVKDAYLVFRKLPCRVTIMQYVEVE